MIRSFDHDCSLTWHARVLAIIAAMLLLAFSLAVNFVFQVELR